MMNEKKVSVYGLIVCSIFMCILVRCDAAPKQEEKKPVSLPVDLPKPPDVGASALPVSKPMPTIKKSNIEFKLGADEIKRRIAESPIKDILSCIEKVKPLEAKRDAVQRHEGMWGKIEQTPELKVYSLIGVQLDSKIHKLTSVLRQLCTTAKGMELTEPAKRINKRREDMGDEKTREYWLELGILPEDIEKYIQYGDFARKLIERTLEFASIQESILWGELFVDQYMEFFDHRFESTKNLNTVIPDLLALDDVVAHFLENDRNVKLASDEASRILPFSAELEQQL